MAAGIARSKFIRPMADAIGWQLGRLRALFKRADYHAPYTDLPRALRILQTHLPEKLPAVLKALNLETAASAPAESGGAQQLALMPPAAAPETALTRHLPPDVKIGLVERLAQAIPSQESVEFKREKVRAILKKHGVDGRFKDEVKALAWVRKAFPDAAFKPDAGAVEVVPDLDSLSPSHMRELIRSLRSELTEKDQQLKQMKVRLGEVNYFLNATKNKMVGDSGLHDVTEDQALFFLAWNIAKKPL
jgi:hypothetical protein